MEHLFSVVTIFTASDGHKIIHSYGPYTEQQANYQRRRMLEIAGDTAHGKGGKLEAVATKILDPERRTPFIWGKDPAK